MQLWNVQQARRPEGYSADLRIGEMRPGVIPRPDDKKVLFSGRFGRKLHELAVMGQRTGLVVVIATGNRKNRDRQPRVLIRRRVVLVPERVYGRVREPFLKHG